MLIDELIQVCSYLCSRTALIRRGNTEFRQAELWLFHMTWLCSVSTTGGGQVLHNLARTSCQLTNDGKSETRQPRFRGYECVLNL